MWKSSLLNGEYWCEKLLESKELFVMLSDENIVTKEEIAQDEQFLYNVFHF